MKYTLVIFLVSVALALAGAGTWAATGIASNSLKPGVSVSFPVDI